MICSDFLGCVERLNSDKDKNAIGDNNTNTDQVKCKMKDCIQSCDDRGIVSVNEKGKTYKLQNGRKDRLIHYKIDGGMLVDNSGVKCDGMIVDKSGEYIVLIELKGIDIRHALEQVRSVYDDLIKISKNQIYARIVSSNRASYPQKMVDPNYKILKKKANLLIKSKIIEENNKDF